VLTNFGDPRRLTVDGVVVGRSLLPADSEGAGPASSRRPAGSCIVVLVTDAPLDAATCARLARRAGLGLARTGSTGDHGSGEIFLALATGLRCPRDQTPARAPWSGSAQLDPLFAAAVEATEEAVLSSLLTAVTVVGRAGHTVHALPLDRLRAALADAR
jgi:D-aminopeptidase